MTNDTDTAEDVAYRCPIHDFETNSKGQMQLHIDQEHPGGAAKDTPEEFRVGVDHGVAPVGGLVCQNFEAHDEEVEMESGPHEGVICPECGRVAGGGPPLEIPYFDGEPRIIRERDTEELSDGGEE